MTSPLRMMPFALDDWWQLLSARKVVGAIDASTSLLWELIRTYNTQNLKQKYGAAGICSTHRNRILWARTTGSGCNSYWRNHSRWPDDRNGRWRHPTKISKSEKFLPALQVMIKEYSKADPPTKKMLPEEADVPELLVKMRHSSSGSSQTSCWQPLAYCLLLSATNWEVHGQSQKKAQQLKQTVQVKLEDITFFKKEKLGQLRCLPKNAPDHLLLMANSATPKQDNQKKVWKGMCVHQETRGELFTCPIQTLGHRVLHLHQNGADKMTFLSVYYHKGK